MKFWYRGMMDSRIRGKNGSGCGNDGLGREDGRWGKGMGPRIREDNEGKGLKGIGNSSLGPESHWPRRGQE